MNEVCAALRFSLGRDSNWLLVTFHLSPRFCTQFSKAET
jgi:hypothetical protein